jgi:isoquinoline 1-oxidoreductase beta subunit
MLGEPRDLDYKEHGGPIFSTGRLAAVLREAARRIDYGRKLPKGPRHRTRVPFHVWRLRRACHRSAGHGRRLAHRTLRVRRGRGTDREPAGIEAQLMGGTIDGLSTAIGLEITVENGRIQQSNFDGYPLMRMPDARPWKPWCCRRT